MKIATQIEGDEQQIKYLEAARRSLSYYFCHNFGPQISPDPALRQKLRDIVIDFSQKFASVADKLRQFYLETSSKADCVREVILNSNRQLAVLELSIPFRESRQGEQVEGYKDNLMEALSFNYYLLHSLTQEPRYFALAKTHIPQIDSSTTKFLRGLIRHVDPEVPEEEKGGRFSYDTEDKSSRFHVGHRFLDISRSLTEKNLLMAMRQIKELENFIYGSLEPQTSQVKRSSALSVPSLKRIYREYYVQLERFDVLYPTLMDYILCFMMVGDIQGALDRFNAVQDLKFYDGQTLRTHQPHLRMILENLTGNSRNLLETFPPDFQQKQENEERGRLDASHFSIRHFESTPQAYTASDFKKKGQIGKKKRPKDSRVLIQPPSEDIEAEVQEASHKELPTTVATPTHDVAKNVLAQDHEEKFEDNTSFLVEDTVTPQERSTKAREEKQEKYLRHLRNEELRKAQTQARIAEEASAAELPLQEAPPTALENMLAAAKNDPRPLSVFYELKGTARSIDQQIENNTWKFTRINFTTYLRNLGCSERRSGHQIMELPEAVIYENNGNLVTILGEELKIGGGSLTLPRWDKIVPDYLRPQILAARETLRQLAIVKAAAAETIEKRQ